MVWTHKKTAQKRGNKRISLVLPIDRIHYNLMNVDRTLDKDLK